MAGGRREGEEVQNTVLFSFAVSRVLCALRKSFVCAVCCVQKGVGGVPTTLLEGRRGVPPPKPPPVRVLVPPLSAALLLVRGGESARARVSARLPCACECAIKIVGGGARGRCTHLFGCIRLVGHCRRRREG